MSCRGLSLPRAIFLLIERSYSPQTLKTWIEPSKQSLLDVLSTLGTARGFVGRHCAIGRCGRWSQSLESESGDSPKETTRDGFAWGHSISFPAENQEEQPGNLRTKSARSDKQKAGANRINSACPGGLDKFGVPTPFGLGFKSKSKPPTQANLINCIARNKKRNTKRRQKSTQYCTRLQNPFRTTVEKP